MRWPAISAGWLLLGCSGGRPMGQGVSPVPVEPQPAPAQVPAEPRLVDIEVGGDSACARRDDGAVYCWGDVYRGYADRPRRIKGLPAAARLSVSEDHACIIDRSGDLWCWGREDADVTDLGEATGYEYGEPGLPHRIDGIEHVARVSTGGSHSRGISRTCVIGEDRIMTCMSWEQKPHRYEELGEVDDVAVGDRYICVLKEGMHRCANVRSERFLPVARDFLRRQGATGLVSVSVSDQSHCGHTEDGRLFCWGPRYCREHRRPLRRFGEPKPPRNGLWNRWTRQVACEITDGTGSIVGLDGSLTGLILARAERTSEWFLTPQGSRERRSRGEKYLDVGAGRYFACGLKRGGEVSCWGASDSGQLGRSNWPPARRYRLPFTRVLAHDDQICAIDPAAGVRCWVEAWRVNMGESGVTLRGEVIPGTRGAERFFLNRRGVCVDVGTGTMRCTRDAQGTLLGWPVSPVQEMGGEAACSVHGDGKLRCRLDDTQVDIIEVDGQPLMGVRDVAFDALGGYALNPDGLYRFGKWVGRTKELPGAKGASQVAVGRRFYCVLVAGRVRCAGVGDNGQLGDGKGRSRPELEDVVGLPKVKVVRARGRHACAVAEDGRLFCWGSNHNGELGDGRLDDHREARVVPGLEGVRDVSVGAGITCAMRDHDTLCWGRAAARGLDANPEAGYPAPRDVPFVIEGFGKPPPEPSIEVVDVAALPPAPEAAPSATP